MTDPTNVFAMDDIKFMTGLHVEPVVASETPLREAIERYYVAKTAAASPNNSRQRHRDQGARGPRRVDDRVPRGPGRSAGDRRGGAREGKRRGADHPPRERAAALGDSAGRKRHPPRAVREGSAHPLPHRRRAAGGHVAGAQVPRPDHVTHQDHGAPRHRREAAAAGRPHQDALQRPRQNARDRLPRLRACRRSSAKRSSSGCSIRKACGST